MSGFIILGLITIVPDGRTSANSQLSTNMIDTLFNRYTYHQLDYQIDTASIHGLYEVDNTHHHPLQEGWLNTPEGQVKGHIGVPQGQLTKVKHGEPGSDLVELTYTIGDVEHKATIRLSDDQFFYLWRTIVGKPLPLSVLDNGDFVVDNYHQPINQK